MDAIFDVLEENSIMFERFRVFFFRGNFDFLDSVDAFEYHFGADVKFWIRVSASKSDSLPIFHSTKIRNESLTRQNVVFRYRLTLLRPRNSS